MTYNPVNFIARGIPQRYSNNCNVETVKHICPATFFAHCKRKKKPTPCYSSSPSTNCIYSSSSDYFYSTTSDSYVCLTSGSSCSAEPPCPSANMGDETHEICQCIEFCGKIGQGCLSDILTDNFCDGDKCLLIDTSVLLVWCSYDKSWKFCNPQPCTPYYFYDTDNYKIWIVYDYGDPAEEFTVDQDNFTIYDYCNDNTYHKIADKWILGCDRL